MRTSKMTAWIAMAATAVWMLPLTAEDKPAPDLAKLMPASCAWIMSCEVTRTLTEPVTMKVVEQFFKRADVQQGVEGFAQFTGLDPRKNITRFCMGGPQLGTEAIDMIAIEGTFDVDQIKGALGQFLPTPPTPYGEHSVYTIPDEKGGPSNYLAIPNMSLLFFGRESAVKAALDAFDGKAKTAEGRSLAADIQKLDAASLVRIAISDLSKIKGDPNPVQPHLRNLLGSISSAKDGLLVTAQAICDTAESAKDIARICDGLLGFAHLQVDHERNPEAKILLATVGPTSVAQNGTEIKASLNVSRATLERLYARLVDKKGGDPVGGNTEQKPGTE